MKFILFAFMLAAVGCARSNKKFIASNCEPTGVMSESAELSLCEKY